MQATLKFWFTRLRALLPLVAQRAIRRHYYLPVVRDYQASDWEWSGVVRTFVPTGGMALDIGANVGYISKLLAEWLGPDGRLVSVEPVPDTFDVLQNGMKRLFGNRVECVPRCVTRDEGEVTMVVPRYEEGGENFYESRITANTGPATNGRLVSVTGESLDHLIRRHRLEPSFIKIDVEGHELTVVESGREYLSSSHPALLIEVAGNPDDPDSAAGSLFRLLAQWGYTPFLLEEDRLQPRKPGDTSVDYFFLTETHTWGQSPIGSEQR